MSERGPRGAPSGSALDFGRRRTAPLVLSLVLSGCTTVPAGGSPCASDTGCPSGLSCLDGRCAPALDDPGGAPRPRGGPVRVLAVGLHPTIEDSVSEASWEAFVRGHFDATVVPRLATDRENFVVLPENTLLSAAFIGVRGAGSRAATDSMGALGTVLAGYPQAIAYYAEHAAGSLPAGRLVVLAVTDTLMRALGPFRALAREHGFWLALTADVAPAHRSTEAADIDALVDEGAADRSFAWVADGDDVFNQTFVIDPAGEIVHAFHKEYLVPVEESEAGLALSYGAPGNLGVLALPFGRVSSVISKDAWMPDVLDRLALDDVELLLQPEAFSGWGIPEGDDGAWPPDVVAESGWVSLLRDAAPRASVLPCWSGNLFELVFDCQSSILTHPGRDGRAGAWIGRNAAPGFADVAAWVAADDAVGTLDERRARLRVVGEALAPGSGDARENDYTAGVAAMDLDLAAPLSPVEADPRELLVAPSDRGEQRRPALVVTGARSFAVFFEDDRGGATRLYGVLGAVDDAGRVALGDARMRVPTVGEPRRVRAAAHGDEVHLVWQETLDDEEPRVMHAVATDGGRSFGAPAAVGSPTATGARRFADVAVAADGTAWVTWVDHRTVAGRVFLATGTGAGLSELGPVEPLPAPPFATRQAQHLPAVAADASGATVVFTEFSEYRWRIARVRCTRPGCASRERVDEAAVLHETIDTDPRIVGDTIVWTDLRVRRPDHDVRLRRGASAETASLATTDRDEAPQLRPALTIDAAGRALVVWQDARRAGSELRFCTVAVDGTTSADAPVLEDAVRRYGPEVVWLDGGLALVASETTTTGERRIGIAALEVEPRAP